MPVTEKTTSAPERRVEDVAPMVSGDQFTPDQRLLAPPFQKVPAGREPNALTELVSSVTAPLIAKALPVVILAPVVRVMLVLARIFPSNAVAVPRVAELPTCQNMLGSAGPTNVTAELDAVVRELPIWKMKVPVGLPVVFSKSAPVNWAE